MYTPELLSTRAKRTPFVPFRVTSASGETFDVTHPRLILVGKREVVIGVASARRPDVYVRTDRVLLTDIVGLADLPS